ncbi:acyl carrier protein [Streptomyces sp. S1D4-11]
MTSVPQPPAVSPTPAADVLAELTAVLAGMMRIEPQALDAQEPFRLLGLDSMLSVEFVAALNARYGTRIAATALYEHPTPQALARHVAAELGTPAPPQTQPQPQPQRQRQRRMWPRLRLRSRMWMWMWMWRQSRARCGGSSPGSCTAGRGTSM